MKISILRHIEEAQLSMKNIVGEVRELIKDFEDMEERMDELERSYIRLEQEVEDRDNQVEKGIIREIEEEKEKGEMWKCIDKMVRDEQRENQLKGRSKDLEESSTEHVILKTGF